MNYVRMLRSALGHRPIVLAGTSVILFQASTEARFLMQQRTDNGSWSMPGGTIEPGESAEEAASREVFEETGWRMSSPKLGTVVSGKDTYYRYPNGDEVFSVTIIFAALAEHLAQDEDQSETKALQWFSSADQLPTLGPPTANMFKVANLSQGRIDEIFASVDV